MEAQPKPLTAEAAEAAEDAGDAAKGAGKGLFFRAKIVAGCQDFQD